MGDTIQRPRFFEGQVLGSADLTASLEYARGRQARHDRLVHEWGIADGLALVASPSLGTATTVRLTAGLAIDGTGREVVVPQTITLDEQLFVRSNVAVADASALYPVLIAGVDTPAVPGPATHQCTAARASRTVEGYKLSFGKPGDERGLERQAAPPLDRGAGGAPDQPRWWILVGFVTWDPAARRFTGVAEASGAARRRFVAVRADAVLGQGGALTLRARPAGQLRAPVVALEHAPAGGTFTLGLDDGAGGLAALARVDELGDLTIAGKLHGRVAGAVKVASGIAKDGDTLPLPAGVSEAQVASGEIALHIMLSPRELGLYPAGADTEAFPTWIGRVYAHAVDAERRLTCLVQWTGFASVGDTRAIVTGTAECQYLVLAVLQG